MADQHNDNIPAVGNTIAADIPDIKENLEWHKDLLQMLLGWKSSTIGTVGPPNHRAKFSHVDDDTITIGPGSYFHDGTTRQTVFWDEDITFDLGSGGSNDESDNIDAGALDWHYIYIDDSNVINNASPELDAECFLNSKTGPTWSDAKHGWYKESDLCIFAIPTDSDNDILEFFHDGGDYVLFADAIADITAQDVDNSYADAESALSIPSFSTKANVTFLANTGGDTAGALGWRTNGQTASTGHYVLYQDNSMSIYSSTDVITDSNQLIELIYGGGDSTNTISGYTNGWYLPNGM